jgi:hypothetical protein
MRKRKPKRNEQRVATVCLLQTTTSPTYTACLTTLLTLTITLTLTLTLPNPNPKHNPNPNPNPNPRPNTKPNPNPTLTLTLPLFPFCGLHPISRLTPSAFNMMAAKLHDTVLATLLSNFPFQRQPVRLTWKSYREGWRKGTRLDCQCLAAGLIYSFCPFPAKHALGRGIGCGG